MINGGIILKELSWEEFSFYKDKAKLVTNDDRFTNRVSKVPDGAVGIGMFSSDSPCGNYTYRVYDKDGTYYYTVNGYSYSSD
jgi:ABC-type molybdate transport system substrate-binding protein